MLGIAFSFASYCAFLLVFGYFAPFTDGVLVPKHVDSGAPTSMALPIDLALILGFGLTHSIMARPRFKQMLTRALPAELERATYVLVASAMLALLIWQWRPVNAVLWRIDQPVLVALLWAANVASWAAAGVATFLIDHFELFGLTQALARFRRASLPRRGFVTPFFYRYVRHPMMTALLLAFWLTPKMTLGHLILAVGMSCYILIGVYFEERALVRDLGHVYLDYQRSTPRFLPFGGKKKAAPRETA